MNTQTERLENHTARLTVEVEPERLERAKATAAKNLAKRLNIPGFRKGKAPYHIVARFVGEGAILEDAVEMIGNEIYPQALDESGVEPYGPGSLDDFKVEDKPVFTFVVPLQPAVELNEYRSVAVDFTVPEITDEDINHALRTMREQSAVVEDSSEPVVAGNRITAFVDGRLVDEDGDSSEAEAQAEDVAADEAAAEDAEAHDHDDEDDEDEHEHLVDEKTVIHEHEATVMLDEEGEPAPGFTDAVVGAAVGDVREFDLTYPDDADKYGDLAGKVVHFTVEIQKIESITLPALNDDFAARMTAEEENPLSLLELRMRIRENLERNALERAKNEHSEKALTAMVEGADVHYPEAMIGEETERFLRRFDQDLRQRGITLDDYMRIYRKSREDLYNDYRETAVRNVERALVLREVAAKEKVTVSDEQIEAEIERNAAQFGMQAESFRELYNQPGMRDMMVNDLMTRSVLDRISDIARGEAPEIPADDEADATAAAVAAAEAADNASEEEGESA